MDPLKKIETEISELVTKIENTDFAKKSDIDNFKTQITELTDKLADVTSKETAQKMTDEIETVKADLLKSNENLTAAINALKAGGKGKTQKEKLFEILEKDFLPAIKKMNEQRTSGKFISLGDVIQKDSTSASFGANILPDDVDPEVGRVLRPQDLDFLSLCNVRSTNGALLTWTNRLVAAGGAGATLEGDPKPSIDYTWTRGTAPLAKTAVFHRMSDEILEDYAEFYNEVTRDMLEDLTEVTMTRLLTDAHAVPTNLRGLFGYAVALNHANLNQVIEVGVYQTDSIIAAATQIYLRTQRRANGVLLNPVDALVIKTLKTATDEYIEVPYMSESGTIMRVDRIPIIENQNIPAGSFLVGAFDRFNVRFKRRNDLRVGFDGNDFRENFVSAIAENRVGCYVKDADVECFVYSTFAAARTWLLTP